MKPHVLNGRARIVESNPAKRNIREGSMRVAEIAIRDPVRPAGLNLSEKMHHAPDGSLSREVPGVGEPGNSKDIDATIRGGGDGTTLVVVSPGLTIEFQTFSIHQALRTVTVEEEG
jgi:hypothetical protein